MIFAGTPPTIAIDGTSLVTTAPAPITAPSPMVMPLVMVASGLSASLMFAPTLSLCAQLAPRQQRGAAYAGFNAAGSLGMICGPLGAGLICHLLEPSMGAAGAYRAAFTAAGASQVVCAAITLPFLLAMRKTRKVDSRAGGALPAT